MRKPFLSLAVVALVAGACSGSSSASPGSYRAPDPGHHQPTPRPVAEVPATDPYVDPAEDHESTFGLDVDTASYTVVRRSLDEGTRPDPTNIRVEEFVNFFDQGYAPPDDEAFAIHLDGGPTPFLARDEVLLRVGLQARDVASRSRPDAALTFVIDVSGSMAREDRLELVKRSLRVLVRELRGTDTIAIVVYGDDARIALEPSRATDARVLEVIDSLRPEGSTNAEAGLRLGYDMAREYSIEEGINRVILLSDGVANVGRTDAEGILRTIRDDAERGIQLVTVGVGMGDYNDALLEQLADQGDGFYAYVDDLDEARRLFVEDLTGTLQTVALDARVQVEFDASVVHGYRLVGFENRAIADDEFRNDEVAAGAIGAGHSVTALYALRLDEDLGRQDYLGTVNLRWTEPESGRAVEIDREVRTSDLERDFHATDEHFKLDTLVAATAEALRGGRWSEGYRLSDVLEVAESLSEDLPPTDEVHEFLVLLRDAVRIAD
jgi:Ca-activated chloride channel family protein